MSKWMIYTLMSLILFLGVFFRFYGLSEIPPGLYPDEAMNGNNALEAITTGDFKWFYPENNGREGLFINIQALSIWLFGNEPWALRAVSALFGTLTILGIYFLTKELFYKKERAELIALLAAFFLAASYWHLNFSRIGFRAITVPFFAAFGIYFLLKALRKGALSDTVLAGLSLGLGFYGYIAFRFIPLIAAVPIGAALLSWWRRRESGPCAPCVITLFLLITLAVVTPLGIYFYQ